MRPLVCMAAMAWLIACPRLAAQQGPAGVPPPIAALLRDIKLKDKELYAVSEEDGKFLRVLASTRGTKRALEIGGASGYSAIWLGLGMRESGGHLWTIEYDATRAKEAAANIQRAGLTDVVTVIAGDAFKEIPKLTGTFDFVFLDAWKPDYLKFFDLMFPRLDKGGVFLAHNVVNKREEMKDFLSAITTRTGAWSTIVSPSSEGMSITYKTR